MCTPVHVYVCLHMCMPTHMCACMHTRSHVCKYSWVLVFVCAVFTVLSSSGVRLCPHACPHDMSRRARVFMHTHVFPCDTGEVSCVSIWSALCKTETAQVDHQVLMETTASRTLRINGKVATPCSPQGSWEFKLPSARSGGWGEPC